MKPTPTSRRSRRSAPLRWLLFAVLLVALVPGPVRAVMPCVMAHAHNGQTVALRADMRVELSHVGHATMTHATPMTHCPHHAGSGGSSAQPDAAGCCCATAVGSPPSVALAPAGLATGTRDRPPSPALPASPVPLVPTPPPRSLA